MLAADGSVSRSILLESERVDLGRTDGEIVLPDDCYLSPRHVRFSCEATRVTVRDLDSLNGVYLKLRGRAELRDGDSFLIGLQLLKFEQLAPDSRAGQPIRSSGCSLFGSSTSPRYARLSELTNDGLPRNVFYVGSDETILGREVGDIVFTGDPFMSRRHAALNRNPTSGVITLTDLGSSNGTFLRVRSKVELKAGDHLRIGQQLFRFDVVNP
jgi:pSer/pThr/pTyr-binding forkhead associated (FHA) protein